MVVVRPGDGRIIEANEAAEGLYRTTRAHLLESRLADFSGVSEGDEPRLTGLVRHRATDGTDLALEARSCPVEYRGEEAQLLLLTDVTPLLQATSALERQRRFFEDILENIDVDIAVFDPELRFEYLNPSSVPDRELREWLIGKTNRDYCRRRAKPLSIAEVREAAIREAVEAGGRVDRMETLTAPDGSTRHLQRSHLPLWNADGSLRRILGYGFDRTEETRKEQALRERKRQLQEKQRLEATGRLAGGVAHEFNNVFTAIAVQAELELERAGLSAEGRSAWDEVLRAARGASRLVDRLLTFGGRRLTPPEPVDLGRVVTEAEPVLRTLVPPGIAVRVDVDGDLPEVVVDGRQFEEALANLVFNAVEAMPRGGELRIAVTPASHGDGVEVVVTDTGEGMEPEVAARAFEPFFSTRSGTHVGLGLSAVYGMVAAAGGETWLDTEPGGGTAVHLRVPPA